MSEHPVNSVKQSSLSASIKKLRLGLYLFGIYVLGYIAFVGLSLASFSSAEGSTPLMARRIAGMNVAVFFGFALIVTCIAMAFAYDIFCGRVEREDKEAAKS